MKINEKHLIAFVSGSAAIDKQGFLNKRGELNKAFQRRWFVLKGNLLFYFERKTDPEPIGVIVIDGCSVELTENSDKYAFELAFSGSGTRTYVLAADSQEEMEAWMRALTCAGYDYMRKAVSDLQQQLNELNDMARLTRREVPTSSGRPGIIVPSQNAAAVGGNRVNPFNQDLETTQEVFPLSVDQKDCRPRRARTFEEMHFDIGEQIRLATAKIHSASDC